MKSIKTCTYGSLAQPKSQCTLIKLTAFPSHLVKGKIHNGGSQVKWELHLCKAFKSHKAAQLTQAYHTIYNRWTATGVISPNSYILDNEAPEEFKQAISENKCRVELTPPDMPRRNIA